MPKREIWLERFAGAAGEQMLFEHLRTLYSREFVGLLKQEIEELREPGMDTLALLRFESIKKRFCELSIFCQRGQRALQPMVQQASRL